MSLLMMMMIFGVIWQVLRFNIWFLLFYLLYLHILNKSSMKTEQIMVRDFNGAPIHQRTSDGFFNATMLLDIYNSNNKKKKVFAEFWSNKGTLDFMAELEAELNVGKSLCLETGSAITLYQTKRGRGGATFMNPYLFVKFAMWLSPKFEVQVIKWVYDNLIDFRHQAGDHYKDMCTAIKDRYVEYYDSSPSPLVFSNESRFLNFLVKGKYKSIERNELQEKELDLLNNLQKLNIKMLNGKLSKNERHNKLKQYAEMYKIANF